MKLYPTVLTLLSILALIIARETSATEFSASFRNTDLEEFINTVGKNLNKTIIVAPSVSGKINVRSYDLFNERQYYQFFLSVLDVYGFAVVPIDNGVLKVVHTKDAQTSAIKIVNNNTPGLGDDMVTRVVPVYKVSANKLATLLQQLIDTTRSGSIVHYEPSNQLLITGRAAVVNHMMEVVRRVDLSQDEGMDIIKLKFASANQIVQLVTDVNKVAITQNSPFALLKVVADQRTNSVMVSGALKARIDIIRMLHQLDQDLPNQDSTRVIYLKYSKAIDMVEVLKEVGASIEADKMGHHASVDSGRLTISADEATNALVIRAHPEVMAELVTVITKLDIRRAQVLVEAIIVEMQDGNGLSLGNEWTYVSGDGALRANTMQPTRSISKYQNNNLGLIEFADDINGMMAGFYRGDWSTLVTALASNTKSDILSTPSIVTMDNNEAAFNIGQEVPIQIGSQSTTSSDQVFNTVDHKTVGTKLIVTPQINEGDSVLLNIAQEVSSVAQTQANGTAELGPTFDTRTVKNSVLVKSGETVVLGGLMDKQTLQQISKVPLLGDIPVLGYLFRSTSNTITKRHLMVFIRPTILHDANVYSGISGSKYTMFRAEQLNAASKARYATSHERLVLPSYDQMSWSEDQLKHKLQSLHQKNIDSTQPLELSGP
ncbi:type II secretion system secretin GspD [Aeromonas veronii]